MSGYMYLHAGLLFACLHTEWICINTWHSDYEHPGAISKYLNIHPLKPLWTERKSGVIQSSMFSYVSWFELVYIYTLVIEIMIYHECIPYDVYKRHLEMKHIYNISYINGKICYDI